MAGDADFKEDDVAETTHEGVSEGAKVVFAVTQRTVEGALVLAIEGELDLASAPSLKWELAEALAAGPKRVILDLSGVSFIDSTALGVLVTARRGLAPGARLVLSGARADVLAVFELTGLDSTFEIVPSLAEAVRTVGDGGGAPG
jgi:anti-sigma B factor antagonist